MSFGLLVIFELFVPFTQVLSDGPHTIKNKQIDPKRAKSRPICKKIFVGGVDSNLPEDDIRKYFSRYGPVEGIELPFDRQRGKRREFCFIIFENEESADIACREAKQTVGGRECDVKKAQPQPVAQQNKMRNQPQGVTRHRMLTSNMTLKYIFRGTSHTILTKTNRNGDMDPDPPHQIDRADPPLQEMITQPHHMPSIQTMVMQDTLDIRVDMNRILGMDQDMDRGIRTLGTMHTMAAMVKGPMIM